MGMPASRKPRKGSGFTLLELLTVIVIILVMLGVSIPVLRNMSRSSKLRASARDLISMMRYARSEAIFGERRTEVFLDTEKRQFWLDLREPEEKEHRASSSGKAKKRQLEHKRDLGQNVLFDAVNTYESNIIQGKLIALDFYPDGSATPAGITLAVVPTAGKPPAPEDKRLTLELIKSTGMIEVTPGTLEEKREKLGQKQTPTAPAAGRAASND